MARNRVFVRASRDEVAGLLADAAKYPRWVVGASELRSSDPEFPAAGSRFYHRVGLKPLTLSDNTEVLASELPDRIVLKAKARPLGTARVELALREIDEGTEVTMIETPGDPISSVFISNPIAEKILTARNTESLARFKRLVDRGSEKREGDSGGLDRIEGARILITGASSGIGLATALALAGEGARLALLARGGEGLDEAARQIAAVGTEPVRVTADITDREALEAAISTAAEQLGGLDAVVANAAESAFGFFLETPPESFDQTVETVLIGTANTVRAALPFLDESGGVFVSVSSLAARIPLPAMSAYTAAKHGLRGLLDTLRIELSEEGSPVSISMIEPQAVDTSFDHVAASATGLLPPRPPAMVEPERVAAEVVRQLRDPRHETIIGNAGRAASLVRAVSRPVADAVLAAGARFAKAGGDRSAERSTLDGATGQGRIRHEQ
ncbi:MAG TPA: SDR family NAD(P)-dependent oxidoreductase [Solirubrobacterales bacterium]|jgi:short-subunit dehydrogenase|nr:SDR family NAD(P)-dependent oxidoreductase [Solirubrobacterales bacterium]